MLNFVFERFPHDSDSLLRLHPLTPQRVTLGNSSQRVTLRLGGDFNDPVHIDDALNYRDRSDNDRLLKDC